MKKDRINAPVISDEILRIALTSRLLVGADTDLNAKQITIDNVLEVVNATPNVNVAVAILLGIYVAPDVPPMSTIALNAALDTYDKWNDQVDYSYDYEEKKSGYIPRNMADDITLETFAEYEIKSNQSGVDDAKWISIPNGKIVRKTGNCKLASWIRGES